MNRLDLILKTFNEGFLSCIHSKKIPGLCTVNKINLSFLNVCMCVCVMLAKFLFSFIYKLLPLSHSGYGSMTF